MSTDPVTNPSPADRVSREMAAVAEIKLGRIGHYFYQTTCATAIITYVWSPAMVNLAVFAGKGTLIRASVPVAAPTDSGSFHLNRDCPWGR